MSQELRTRNPGLGSSLHRYPAFVFRLLASKEFLLWIIGGWIIYYVMTAIWYRESFANFVMRLEEDSLFRIPFVIFLVSGYLNLYRASKEVYRRGIIQFVPWLILPLGLMFFSTGYYISLTTRQFSWIVVGEGHEITLPWSGEKFRVGRIESGMKDKFLDIDEKSGGSIFKYEPTLTVLDSSGSTSVVGAFPATKIGGAHFHILNFGLAPGVRLWEDGLVRSEGYMPLRILGAGSGDSFEIEPYPYKFLITFEPDRTFQKGSQKASEYNLADPLYSVRVFKGETVIAEGDSRNKISFENMTLGFFPTITWVLLEVVKDYGYPVVVLGIFMISAGIPLTVLRYLHSRRPLRK